MSVFFPIITCSTFSYLRRRGSCSDAEVRAHALKSFMLNGISVLSIYVFDFFLQPLAHEQPPQKWLHRSLGWFYHVLWLLPVVGVSLYLNVRTRILNPLFSGVRHLFTTCLYFPRRVLCAGLMVRSHRKARLHLAARPCISVCRDDFDHVSKRVHRLSQLTRHVRLSCRYDRDMRLPFVCTGLRPRHWRSSGNHFLLLGERVSRSTDAATMTGPCCYFISRKVLGIIALSKSTL
jgi:hypothetical protein